MKTFFPCYFSSLKFRFVVVVGFFKQYDKRTINKIPKI